MTTTSDEQYDVLLERHNTLLEHHQTLVARYKALTQELSKQWAILDNVKLLCSAWRQHAKALREEGDSENWANSLRAMMLDVRVSQLSECWSKSEDTLSTVIRTQHLQELTAKLQELTQQELAALHIVLGGEQ